MKPIVAGVMAHVDAGKTTLTEAMLYAAGAIQRQGRVDKGESVLDGRSMERERGITIYSKQVRLELTDTVLQLIDTPGHVDFSCETERALSVLDYAVLLVSAKEGVRPHTRTLWQLLSARRIPTFIFVNKTDISDRIRSELLEELKTCLSPACVDFTPRDRSEFYEACAECDPKLIGEFLDTEGLTRHSIAEAIGGRRIFPVLFGSALKQKGVRELLEAIDRYTLPVEYSDSLFGMRVYKIDADSSGRRITLAKITGGSLKPKDELRIPSEGGMLTERVEELRTLFADRSRPLKEARAGELCAILGPTRTKAGMGLGFESSDSLTLAPVLNYTLILPDGVDPYDAYGRLSLLADEDPALALRYDPRLRQISVSLMGEVQREILQRTLKDRFSLECSFSEGRILYKETIAEAVVGRGHFEPLRHYAEVHLLLEPIAEGEGIQRATVADRDALATNWQRLVLGHIGERIHRGVLIGAPLTDLRVTLLAGKAHLKHTEGGDFREATYRAIRQGLMKARSVLLEPTFDYTVTVPLRSLGRVLTDLENMHAEATTESMTETEATVTGNCSVATMRGYPLTLRAFTGGEGRINMVPGAYRPCHNAEEVIAAAGYDPEAHEGHSPSSVFCRAGAGYTVPWDEADGLMHIKDTDPRGEESEEGEQIPLRARRVVYRGTAEEDKELMRIFESTYGKIKRKSYSERTVNEAKAPTEEKRRAKPPKPKDRFLLVDCYNLIFADEGLRSIAERDFALARDTLVRTLCDYAAFVGTRVIAVFDAYRVKRGEGSVQRCGAVTVVYTKEAQTADAYIEQVTYRTARDNEVRVVTSDLVEQYVILGNGALRVSVKEFMRELSDTASDIRSILEDQAMRSGK